MKGIVGDAWKLKEHFNYLAITTNGFVKTNEHAVMGRGIAKQAKDKYPGIDHLLGKKIQALGNHVHLLTADLVSFPVKHNWWEEADIELIKRSCNELMAFLGTNERILLPRPGCGNGKLKWEEVKKVIEPLLDDRVYIIHLDERYLK